MAITGAPTRFPTVRRILAYENSAGEGNLVFSDELAVSSSDSVFGFLEGSVESTTSNEDDAIFYDDDDEGEYSFEENKNFWDNQHNLLQVIFSGSMFFFFIY